MLRPSTWLSAGAAICVLLGAADPAAARRGKQRNVYDLDEDFVSGGTGIGIPITAEGAGFYQSLGGAWQPWRHFATGMNWAYFSAPDDTLLPGNLRLWLGTGFGSKVEDGFGAYLDLDFTASFGLVGKGDESRQTAARLVQSCLTSWTWFMPGAVVLQADLTGAVFMNHTVFSFSLEPQLSVPYEGEPSLAYRSALEYGGGLSFAFGNHRGHFGLGFGFGGIKEFTGEAGHQFDLDASIFAQFSDLGFRLFLGVSIPVLGAAEDLLAVVYSGVSFRFDVRIKPEEQLDPLPPSTDLALVPRSAWAR